MEGKAERGGGFFDKWLFIGTVRQPKEGGEGILWTCRLSSKRRRGDKRMQLGDPTGLAANLAILAWYEHSVKF